MAEHIFFSKISSDAPTWGAWIKDALLIGWRREEKSPPPGGIWIHDLSFAPQVCSLPLCYNHCPRRVYDVFYVQLGNKLRPNKMSFGPRFLIDSPYTRNTNLRLMVFCWWIVFGLNSKWFFRLNYSLDSKFVLTTHLVSTLYSIVSFQHITETIHFIVTFLEENFTLIAGDWKSGYSSRC